MEDEADPAVVTADEPPWCEEDVVGAEEAATNAIDSDNEPEAFDEGDWVNPDEAKDSYAPTSGNLRCHGDTPADTDSTLPLGKTRAPCLVDFQAKMRALKDCYESLRALQSPITHSLADTVENVFKREQKRVWQAKRKQADIFTQMDAILQADDSKRRRLKDEYDKAMSQAKEKCRLERQLSEGRNFKHIHSVVTELASPKPYSPEMLGQGKKGGGTKDHRQNRWETLERVRRLAYLTPEQIGQWEFFKTEWDSAQANEHGMEWGKIFAESIQAVLYKLLEGDTNAFSQWVKDEWDRVLSRTGALVIPGIPNSKDIEEG